MSKFLMHGPAEFEMKVWVVDEYTGHTSTTTVSLGAFEYPTRETIAERMNVVVKNLEDSGYTGFRLATKAEAFRAWSILKVGEPIALPGGSDWDEI